VTNEISFASQGAKGIQGDSLAIADARAMVETMGGMAIWAELKSVHFVDDWYPWNRVDSYIDNEILDLTGPGSWADRKSEINHTIRAYSPEGKRWDVTNGEFAYASEEALNNDPKELLSTSADWSELSQSGTHTTSSDSVKGASQEPVGLNFVDLTGHWVAGSY